MQAITRKEQAEITRKLILKTAEDLLCTENFERVKISDICKKADISTGAFYHYFEKKDDIYFAIYEEIYERFDKLMRDTTAFDPKKRILEYMKMHAQVSNERGVIFVANFYRAQLIMPSELFFSEESSFVRNLTELVREAQKSGDINEKLDAAEIAMNVIIIGRGVLYNWSWSDGKFDVVQRGQDIIEHYLESL